jgi:hypothetical protein
MGSRKIYPLLAKRRRELWVCIPHVLQADHYIRQSGQFQLHFIGVAFVSALR